VEDFAHLVLRQRLDSSEESSSVRHVRECAGVDLRLRRCKPHFSDERAEIVSDVREALLDLLVRQLQGIRRQMVGHTRIFVGWRSRSIRHCVVAYRAGSFGGPEGGRSRLAQVPQKHQNGEGELQASPVPEDIACESEVSSEAYCEQDQRDDCSHVPGGKNGPARSLQFRSALRWDGTVHGGASCHGPDRREVPGARGGGQD